MSFKTFNRRGGFHFVVTGHRSGLEDKISEQIKRQSKQDNYEKYNIKYTIPASTHTYTPDFVLSNGIIIEAKGVFDAADRRKHLLIKQQYPNLDIRFVFSNAKAKIYKGSNTSLSDWCLKYGFQYATKEIPRTWFKEEAKNTKGLIQRKE